MTKTQNKAKVCSSCDKKGHSRSSNKECEFYIPRKKNALRSSLKRSLDTFVSSTTVKTGLRVNSVLRKEIKNSCLELTHITVLATRLTLLFVHYHIDHQIVLPDMSYNSFLRQPFEYVANGRCKNTVLPTLFQNYQTFDVKHRSQLISNMAFDYHTNCMNHIATNYKAWTERRCLVRPFISRIIPEDEELDFRYWWTFLPEIADIQRDINAYNACRESKFQRKSFTLLPLADFTRRHIRIDTDALYGLLRRTGLYSNKLEMFRADPSWSIWFPDIEKLTTRNKQFAFGCASDGVAISFFFQKVSQKTVFKETQYGFAWDNETKQRGPYNSIDDVQNIIGVDLGRTDIFTSVDSHGFSEKMASTEFHSINRKTAKLREKWIVGTGIKTHLIPSAKINPSAHMNYIAEKLPGFLHFWTSERITRHKFKRYISRQQKWEIITKRIVKHPSDIVALGDAPFLHNSKGLVTTPKGRFVKELKKKARVRVIDEYKTSKICSVCDEALRKVFKTVRGKRVEIWKVKSCNRCLIWWDRDVNAGRNMRKIFNYMNTHEGEKPEAFQRPQTTILS